MQSGGFPRLHITSWSHFEIWAFVSQGLGSQPPSGEIWNWPPYTRVRERPKKDASHSMLVGLVNKGNCIWRLSQEAARWMDLCTPSPDLKSLYRGLKRVQSRAPSRWSKQHITIPRRVLEAASVSWEGEQNAIPRTGEGRGSLWFLGSSHRSLEVMSSWWPPSTNNAPLQTFS